MAMICSVCKKNEATVHLTQIIENKMQTIDLCEACSKAKGVDDPSGFSLASIMLGLGTTAEAAENQSESEVLKCPTCGFTQVDFKKIGRLGCAECYNTFMEPLMGVLKSMHKGTKHCGKVPRMLRTAQDINTRIQGLQKKLDQAVASENFEEAAILRDQLKQTRKELNQIASS